jgi:hypothetical protein
VSTTVQAPRVSREEQRERMRRARAAAQAVRVTFPAMQQLRLELEFSGAGASVPASQTHVLHPPARAFFEFQCPYADCDGRFDLTDAVNAALASPEHRATGTLECTGLRARDHLSKQACALHLRYAIHATYKQGR